MKGIKLDEIKLNFKYKNLKELSQICKIEYKDSTNSRKKIIKELECYLKLEKNGRGYIVKEIYTSPKPKNDNRGKNKNSHKHSTSSYEELEYIILNYINGFKDTIFVSNNVLASNILTTNNYYYAYNNIKYFNGYLKKKNKLSNNTITRDLFKNINTSVKGIIQTCLKKLEEKYNLEYNYNYILIENDFDKDGNIIEKTREAEEEEIKIINETTKQYIKEFNKEHDKKIKNLNDVCYLKEKLYNKFYQDLNTEVFDALYNNDGTEIKMYFKGYIIKKLNNIDKILKDINIKELKEKLNKKFIENSINNITRQIEKKKIIINEYINDKIEEMDILGYVDEKVKYKIGKNKFGYRDMLMLKDKYKKEYINILKIILDISGKDITFEINKIKNK